MLTSPRKHSRIQSDTAEAVETKSIKSTEDIPWVVMQLVPQPFHPITFSLIHFVPLTSGCDQRGEGAVRVRAKGLKVSMGRNDRAPFRTLTIRVCIVRGVRIFRSTPRWKFHNRKYMCSNLIFALFCIYHRWVSRTRLPNRPHVTLFSSWFNREPSK